jgi:hypothetical protein
MYICAFFTEENRVKSLFTKLSKMTIRQIVEGFD